MARQTFFALILVCIQAIFLILFGLFVRYDPESSASNPANSRDENRGGPETYNTLSKIYPMFQDVHVMIFIGFGFLMTFLKRYGYSSVGFNFMISAFGIQWATLLMGFFHLEDDGYIHTNITMMLGSDFAVAAVLISFGAVLGKVSPFQLIFMTFVELVLFVVNEVIGRYYLGAVDMGDSIFVHTFGAYFGLAVAGTMYNKHVARSPASDKQGPVYHSDLFSMIGTIFLWLYWPSFNSALAPGDDQHRAVINTYYSLCSCTVVVFAFSSIVEKGNKFSMEHIQNATLAGGVAVGAVSDMMIQPWGAVLIGIVAGVVSVLGFKYLSPFMDKKMKIHDTCGVHNLHGLPGVMASIASIIMAALATTDMYGNSLYQIYPNRAPPANSSALLEIQEKFSAIEDGKDWSATYQAAMQAAAFGVTLGIALVGGAVTGLLMRFPFCGTPDPDELYDDEPNWEMPEEGESLLADVPKAGITNGGRANKGFDDNTTL